MIACPYLLSVRDPYHAPLLTRPDRWLVKGEFPDVVKAREAARSLRRFWPWVAVRITYPPVGD